MRKLIPSLILLVIIFGCATVKTNEIKETKNENIKSITTLYWENSVKDLQEKIRKQKEYEDKLAAEKAKRIHIIPLSTKKPEIHKYEIYEVTAYNNGFKSTGKNKGDKDYGITASGEKTKEDRTLACPKSLPFGTEIYIPYFDNTFTCQDRGSAITSKHLDVYMESLDAALEFGRQKLEIEIVSRPDES